MSKLFSFSRSQTMIILTMASVLILGAAYIFIYIPGHKRRVEELRFRCLQNIQTNIKAKRDNSVALLRNLLVTHILDKDDYNRDALKDYIAAYTTDNFTLTQPGPAAGIPEIDGLYRRKPGISLKEIDARYPDSVVITLINDQLNIFLYKGAYNIGMKYTLSQFFGSLLPLDTYDQYLVMLDTAIIYQTFESGITKIQADSLPTRQGAFLKDQVKNVVIGGAQYKLLSQQLHLDRASVLTVIGLLKSQTYQNEKNALPGNVVLFLMIISIATILILPWIKLYQIGGQDRLTAADGMLTFPIAMLFISILFFTSFKYNFGFGQARVTAEDSKKNLAAGLENSFMEDLTRAYDELTVLDGLFRKGSGEKPLTGHDTLPDLGKIRSAFQERSIERVFWLDAFGHELVSWTSFEKNAPSGNFSNREYFRNIRDNKPFFLKNDRSRPFYLEPVVSWNSGRFVSVISKRSGGDKIAAMSFNLNTTDHSVLPAGLSYCIINEKGRVLYHSNASRNLNEDLFSELTDPDMLKSSILARSNVFFKSGYRGKRYDIYAKSFGDLPFQIVVFEDTEIKVNRDMSVSYFCFFMLLGLFLLIIVELLLVFLLSYHTSYFKKHYFDISWIGPDERFHNQYVLSTCWNIINILLLWLVYHFVHFLEFLAILLVSVTTVILFLNYQYQFFYRDTKSDTEKSKKWVSWVLIFMILLITMVTVFFLPSFPIVLLMYVIGLFILIGMIGAGYQWDWILKKQWKVWGIRDVGSSFFIMVFSALIITSGIPVAVLFNVSNTQELKLFGRYRHKLFADEIIRQYPAIGDSAMHISAAARDILPSNAFPDRAWIKDVEIVTDERFMADSLKYAGKAGLDTLYDQLIPYHADLTPDLSEFNRASSAGYTYYWDNGVNITYSRLHPGTYLRLRSTGLQYENSLSGLNGMRNAIMYWMVFVVILVAFGAILYRILRKLFALDFPAQDHWEEIDEMILTEPELNSLVFVLGSPGSGKMKVLREMLASGSIKRQVEVQEKADDQSPSKIPEERSSLSDNAEGNIVEAKAAGGNGAQSREEKKYESVSISEGDYVELDLILIPEKLDAPDAKDWNDKVVEVLECKKSLIIVNHFEYDIKNPATNHYKLDLLEKLMQNRDRKVMIVSTVHPMHFLDSVNNQLKTIESLSQNDRERWNVLLGHFRIIIHKLKVGTYDAGKDYPQGLRILSEETNRGHFLVKMQDPIETKFSAVAMTNAEGSALGAKIGISAHYFYTYVWQSLTKEEKFLLYDLAEDGLMNPYDDYNITILMSKGLIIRRHGLLKLFNEGFRTFILTAIGNSEVMLIRNQIRESGNWNKLKTPLIVLAVAVLVFLYASQNEAYAEIIKYVGLITVTVPTVYKVFEGLESVFQRKDVAAPKKE